MRKPWRSFLLFIGLGAAGAAALIPYSLEAVEATMAASGIPETELPPAWMLGLLSMINPLLLTTIAVVFGHLLAHRTGLTSVIVSRDRGESDAGASSVAWTRAGIAGLLLAVLFLVTDLLLGDRVPATLSFGAQEPSWYTFGIALLYGGIVEEIMMRWGLMSLLVFVGWKWFQRKKSTPGPVVFWSAILLSSFLFALGHYGATALEAEVTAVLWFRMLVLNGAGGIVFGWLFWKYNLETAMAAHMGTHLALHLLYFLFLA
ncbi:CPBP family intramembrane glutamic endopeptidase [Alkalicoccus chagannorensis]|uniref:CPBP family intramembrane glutamic endopeptidase n=1 Tax=Alkalicoccus chagannorensis TaxID=427072 RepID=UPI000403E433|nr:CPBP family intramembrane glutamic endopeptidase [Alkalicoccus chagannorensis]